MKRILLALTLALALTRTLPAAVQTGPSSGGGGGSFTNLPLLTNIVTGVVNGNYIPNNLGFGTNTTIRDGFKSIGQQTNSTVVITNGGQWFQSAMWGGGSAVANGTNVYGGGMFWVAQGDTGFPYEDTGTPMAALQVFDNWGGAASSAISPWMLITAPNIRLENGYGAGYGEIALGNEDAAGSIYLNWNRGPTLTQYDTANYKGFSIPLSFEADVTDASVNHRKVFPGIIGYAPDYNANADPTSGLRQGELWFQSLTAYRLNGGWAQNGANAFGSNTVFRMRTNMVTFDGQLGVNGTSKTHINGGSITNTDITSKIIGTDSNGKFTGATLSGLTWDGTTLTASGSGTSLWNTNATDGNITNILGGVSVGTGLVAITNGGVFLNFFKSAAAGTPRGMMGGSGVATTWETNRFAGTNGSGFFVLDASGNQTNSNVQHVGGVLYVGGVATLDNNVNIGSAASGRLVAIDATAESTAALILGNGNSATRRQMVLRMGTGQTTNVVEVQNISGNVLGRIGPAGDLYMQTITATNGFFLSQLSAIPSVDLRSSSGNTNWLLFNLGGDVAFIKTNPAAASSYFTNYQTVQLDFVQGSTAGTPVSLSTGTAANITSISLTPGTWDLTANIYFDFAGATVTSIEGAISTTSATISSPPPEEVSAAALNLTTTSADYSLNITRRRVTITSTTTYYLVGRAAFSAGSIDGYGKLLATRVN